VGSCLIKKEFRGIHKGISHIKVYYKKVKAKESEPAWGSKDGLLVQVLSAGALGSWAL
jgi:hypothetical protein